MHASGLWSFVKLQSQNNIFAGNNNHFSIKPTVVWVKISEKNHQFFRFEISYHRLANRENLILPLRNSFKSLKDLALPARNFLSHLQFFKSGRKNAFEILTLDATIRDISRSSYYWYWFYRWSSSSVWCSSSKNTIVDAGNLQMITNKFSIWTLMGTLCTAVSGPSFAYSFIVS